MEKLVLNQRGLSYLSRINRCVSKEMGCQFKLSNQSHLIELLQISAVSPIQEIQNNFKELLIELEPRQRDLMQNLGVSLPD